MINDDHTGLYTQIENIPYRIVKGLGNSSLAEELAQGRYLSIQRRSSIVSRLGNTHLFF